MEPSTLLRSAGSLPEVALRGGESAFKVFCDTMRAIGFDVAKKWDHAVCERQLPDGRKLQDILNERGSNVTALAFYGIVFAGVHLIWFKGSHGMTDSTQRDGALFGAINFKTGEMDLRDIKFIYAGE